MKRDPSKRRVGRASSRRVRLFPTRAPFRSRLRALRAWRWSGRLLKFGRGLPINAPREEKDVRKPRHSGANVETAPTTPTATRQVFLPRPARRGTPVPGAFFFRSACPERNLPSVIRTAARMCDRPTLLFPSEAKDLGSMRCHPERSEESQRLERSRSFVACAPQDHNDWLGARQDRAAGGRVLSLRNAKH